MKALRPMKCKQKRLERVALAERELILFMLTWPGKSGGIKRSRTQST
jgi:hypothetical protein